MILEHLGPLHPFESVLVYVLAFGPVLLLVVTVIIARRRDARTDELDRGCDASHRPL